jgi:alpha-galactosidase
MRRSVPLLRSDYIFDPVGNQGHTYGLSFWLPFQGTGVHPNQFSLYELRSNASCSHQTLCWDVRDRSLDYDLLRRHTRDWRSYAGYYLADYYPLTPYSLAADAWIAWQFNQPEQGGGMVQAFRREASSFEVGRFKLRDLDANARYTVTDVDAPEAHSEYSGAELMEKGIRVSATNQPAAVVLLYKKNP